MLSASMRSAALLPLLRSSPDGVGTGVAVGPSVGLGLGVGLTACAVAKSSKQKSATVIRVIAGAKPRESFGTKCLRTRRSDVWIGVFISFTSLYLGFYLWCLRHQCPDRGAPLSAWCRHRRIAPWSAQTALVVKAEGSHIRTWWQLAVAHWRNNQVADRRIDRRQRLRDTTSVRAIGDIQFCSDFLMCQLNQPIATALARCWLTYTASAFAGRRASNL
jgi:hypothetical protein